MQCMPYSIMIGAVVRSISSTSPMLICLLIVAMSIYLHIVWFFGRNGVRPS